MEIYEALIEKTTVYPLEDILFLFLFGLYVIIYMIICTPVCLYDRIKRRQEKEAKN